MSTPRVDMSEVHCGTGTYIEKMNAAIRFSEERRARTVELSIELGAQVTAELTNRHRHLRKPPPTKAHLDSAIEKSIEIDPRWRNAVADEQWGYRLTTMYGIAELVAATRENTRVLKAIHEQQQTQIVDQRRLLAEQQTTNELLKMLVGRLSVPTDRTSPPAPPQRTGGAPANTIDPKNPHPAGW